jgi:hypothetical protein
VVPCRSCSRNALWGVDDQGLELPDGLGAADDRTVPCGDQDPEGFSVTAGSGGGQMLTGQRFAGSADGVELVALGAVTAGRPGGTVDLNDPLPVFQ